MTGNGEPLNLHHAQSWAESAQKVCGLDLKAETDLGKVGASADLLVADRLLKGDMNSSPS